MKLFNGKPCIFIFSLSFVLNLWLIYLFSQVEKPIYQKDKSKYENKEINSLPVNKVVDLPSGKEIHIMENTNEDGIKVGFVDIKSSSMTASIGWLDHSINVIYKYEDGDYSHILDRNANGIPDIGVLRGTNERVSFKVEAVPMEGTSD